MNFINSFFSSVLLSIDNVHDMLISDDFGFLLFSLSGLESSSCFRITIIPSDHSIVFSSGKLTSRLFEERSYIVYRFSDMEKTTPDLLFGHLLSAYLNSIISENNE